MGFERLVHNPTMSDALDGLSTFLAVGRHKSFTAAAAAIGVTPTAVSKQVKLLERRLGVVLFQRTTRRVALTEPGARLLARLGPAIADVEDALGALGDYRDRPYGNLRITAPRTSVSILAPLMMQMRDAYPELSIEVSLDDAFVDLVERGFDAGIRLGDSVEKDMIRVPITKDSRWSIVGAPSYLARAGRPRKPEDLMSHRTIRQRMIATGVVDDIGLMVALAAEGAGLAYVPDELAEARLEAGQLERVLQAFLTAGPSVCLYFPARMQEQPKLRALIAMVKRCREAGANAAKPR
jgi:DNA-binding transcriptional LysR family regulator